MVKTRLRSLSERLKELFLDEVEKENCVFYMADHF